MKECLFAFGSNMSRERLEARIGPVDVRGAARLVGHRHRFSHEGVDGTGQGNIEPESDAQVHGVLYQLDPAQFERLDIIQRGYTRTELRVWSLCIPMMAWAYMAPKQRNVAPPSLSYLEHYRRGIEEHDLPGGYGRWVLSSWDA